MHRRFILSNSDPEHIKSMSTIENTPSQSTPKDTPVPDPIPSVTVNKTTQSIPTSNRANPNMVMALVICFMLIIGLALAFLFELNEGTAGSNKVTEESEKAELQRLIDAERGGASFDSRASTAILEGKISAIMEDARVIQSEFGVMKAGYIAAQEKLTQAGNELQGNMSTISRLGSENTALRSQIMQLQELARNAQAYQNQAQQLANTIAEKDALIASMQDRPTSQNMELLQKTLSSEQETKEKLMAKIQELEQMKQGVSVPGDLAKVEDLEKQNEDLRKALQAIQTSADFGKLFTKSHKTLPENAQELYHELKGLEKANKADLPEAYTRIASELNAVNLQRVKFEEGSSILTFTDQTKIKSKLDTTDPTDYFLVVGYASLTGNAAKNEALSANRATAVASIVNQLKRGDQDVRAVYLGQTDRFSKEEHKDNQLCEIWRIKK